MINPDDKGVCVNGSSSASSCPTGTKQPRRRLGQGLKSSAAQSGATPKRLRGPRSTKGSRALSQRLQQREAQQQQQQISATQQVQVADLSAASAAYDTPQWNAQLESESAANHLYEPELYATSVNTPTTNSNGNSTACISSTYPYDDGTGNYIGNTSSATSNNGDYPYHHPHHFHHHHHHHSHTLYQHHHGSNYDAGSTSVYYLQQSQQPPVLTDHPSNSCSLSIDSYHSNQPGTYSLQQASIDPSDEHLYLHVHSTSSHSSSASLSPPTNTNLVPSSSSGSSSSTYPHAQKSSSSSSSSGGYLHPTSNGTLTLYSHHHQHLAAAHHPHSHHSDIDTLFQMNGVGDDEDFDDDDEDTDLLTLVHHHQGAIDDHQTISSFHPTNNHQIHSHNDASTSILRTVLKRPIVGKNHLRLTPEGHPTLTFSPLQTCTINRCK